MSNEPLSAYYLMLLPIQSAHNLLIGGYVCVLVVGQKSLVVQLCVRKYLNYLDLYLRAEPCLLLSGEEN